MPSPTSSDSLELRKRRLHLRIARSRRRIDRRLRAAGDDARRLVDWRTYVVRYPGWALAAALGAGMAAANLLRPAPLARRLGHALCSQALGGLRQGLTAELKRLWADSKPDDSRHGNKTD